MSFHIWAKCFGPVPGAAERLARILDEAGMTQVQLGGEPALGG
ncbi:MAG: hypothetical protein U0904_03980 [Candidatus Nanopelagicales bacterium]|nr:hypothetical protein [Candidatus Nanopelagicales bacterium]